MVKESQDCVVHGSQCTEDVGVGRSSPGVRDGQTSYHSALPPSPPVPGRFEDWMTLRPKTLLPYTLEGLRQ